MNDIDSMPPKCNNCSYWEMCEYPYVCPTQGVKEGIMDKEKLTEYIKWLLSQLDEINSNDIDKDTVKTMLLSIIGEMYTH